MTRHLLFLFPEAEKVWFQKVRTHLPDSRFLQCRTIDEAWTALNSKNFDAVIAPANSESVDFFEGVRQNISHRPILAMVLKNAPNAQQMRSADLVLPDVPVYIGQLLHEYLRMNTENETLRKEKLALAEELAQLKTTMQAQQRAMEEVNLLKNAIVRNVSHELKTPLLQVKSAVALLAEDVSHSSLAQYATDATARLEGVIRNITQLGDSLDVSMSPVLIREIVEFAKRNLRRSWERKDETVRIREEFDPNLPTAFGNKHGLGTVLQQLIDNALKFSDREVIVRARVVGEKVELCVQDFGIGIMQDKLDAIFESFYQIDSSATRKYGGAGVGLAIVKLILDRHNAPIQVNSVVGEGSTFTFQLPIVDLRSTKR